MGWSYENRVAYGVQVTAWGNDEIRPLLKKYKGILSYDKDMSLGEGTIFVYVNSTYLLLDEDSGSYSGGRLDTLGDDFTPPRHRCYHRVDYNRQVPNLTPEESNALTEVQSLSENKCCWVEDARVYY